MAVEITACRIVAEALGQQGNVNIDDGMATLAAWDSLAHMGIVLGIEAEIGRSLAAEEIASIASVRDVAVLLAGATGGS